ncbi:GNAT family N-acetyltransferase [Psychrobacter sp. 1176_08]|uniref:GNAT family N-acetyltransferase n=1 Tax=Psychrobacter sp. 1176_08 TaxID=2604452 RepID=UPI00406295FD
MKILKLSNFPAYLERAAVWFSDKWGIPTEIYKESMQISIDHKESIPQWYITLDESHSIIAGFGVIENDFHERKDLSPNLCALYVEEDYRNLSIARKLLDFAKEDMSKMHFKKLYLITDHEIFYEKCGWDFLTMVQEDDGGLMRMYVTDTLGYP